ncbi:MAG: OmpA family protein [Congregibacter sp.]
MSSILRIVGVILMAGIMSACTSTTERQYEACIVGLSTLGGVVGATAGGTGAVAGVAVGAGVSPLLCNPAPPSDADGDGVPDDSDRCPNTPAGTAVDANGCALDGDRDGDGVKDSMDRCPNTQSGVKVDARGCALDSDGDGVPDHMDRCANTPAGVSVDRTGCPIKDEIVFTVDRLGFAFDSYQLDAKSRSALDAAIPVLRSNSQVKMDIVGHTDNTGPEAYNEILSEKRAQAALDYLVSRGVTQGQLRAVGRGESNPVASNSTEDGRSRNRRVELVVR